MKLWSSEHIFKHPWKQTTEAVWKKYPNDQMPNVAFIDVLDRKITEDGKLQTTRLFGSEFSFPKLITALLGMPDICYAIEYSEVDLKNQKMTLKMVNYTFGSVLTVREKLVYQPNKENPNETQLIQGAKINIDGIQFASYFEDMLVNRFESTSKVGRSAIENVLKKITVENILHAIKEELQELSSDVDRAATKFDSEFNISERVQDLSKDLDKATAMINTEIQTFSNNLHSEFVQLVNSLNSELSQVVIKVKTSDQNSTLDLSNIGGLTAAVKQAGISVKRDS